MRRIADTAQRSPVPLKPSTARKRPGSAARPMSLLAMQARSPAANSGYAPARPIRGGPLLRSLTASDSARGKFHSILYDKRTGNSTRPT